MTNAFSNWLSENGLREVFTTHAGDTFYVNKERKIGVLKKGNGFNPQAVYQYDVQSFYLDDIIEFKTYDDENLLTEWNRMMSMRAYAHSTRYSTNEIYINIRFKNRLDLKLQIFRGTRGNIKRNTRDHINMLNYAYKLSQALYNCIHGIC